MYKHKTQEWIGRLLLKIENNPGKSLVITTFILAVSLYGITLLLPLQTLESLKWAGIIVLPFLLILLLVSVIGDKWMKQLPEYQTKKQKEEKEIKAVLEKYK